MGKKYIDADKLIAEIESRMEDCKYPDGTFPTTTNIVRYEELSCLRNHIDSLQQEQLEVDLEKEYNTWWNSISDKINVEHVMEWYMHETARHFYELGLSARKEEQNETICKNRPESAV